LGIRFGALAVLKGWVNQKTVDYFLENLVSEAKSTSDFQYKNIAPNSFLSPEKKELILPSSVENNISYQEQTLFISESTVFIDGKLISFSSQGEYTDESYDLSQSLDYYLVFSE